MPIIDIRRLSERAVAILNEHNQVTIATREGATLPLSPAEARQFQAFLNTNEPRLTSACGGTPLRERIRVWLPETACEALDEDYRLTMWPMLQHHWGRASICGRIAGNLTGGTYLGGFSPDGSLFVLFPYSLYEARYREILLQICGKDEPDLYQLAASIEKEERQDDPAADNPSPKCALAWGQAADVAYWLEFAGPEPTMHDSRDARHKARR